MSTMILPRIWVLLFVAITAGSRMVAAQRCAHPVRDTTAEGDLEIVPYPLSVVRSAVIAALRERGYRIAEQSDSTVATAPRARWPALAIPLDPHYREHRHPGVVLRVAFWPAVDSTWMDLTVRTACGVPPEELTHGHPSIESIVRIAARLDVGGAIIDQLHGRIRRPVSAAAGTRPPRLLSCPPPTTADTMIRVLAGDSVLLSLVVDTTGLVDTSTVTVVSPGVGPAAIFRARRLVTSCLFQPALEGGIPVRARIRQPVRFTGSPDSLRPAR